MESKVVLITGASEGIGAACAGQLRRKGAKLSLTALPGPGFQDHSDGQELVSAGDITDDGFRRALVRKTLDRFGRVDVLINAVGVGLYAPPSTVDVELSKRLFDINVFAPLALTQLIIPGMRARGSGTIVNLGSVGGRVSLPWSVMYCATKFAVHAVNDSLRRTSEQDQSGGVSRAGRPSHRLPTLRTLPRFSMGEDTMSQRGSEDLGNAPFR